MREEPAGARMVENTDLIKLPGLEHADVGGVDSVYDLLGGGVVAKDIARGKEEWLVVG